MASMTACDAFACFYLLLFGLVLVAAVCMGRNDRSPTRDSVRGLGRLPARLYHIENRLPVHLTGPNSGHTHVRGVETSGLEVYVRRFEEAIERARRRGMGFRGEKDR